MKFSWKEKEKKMEKNILSLISYHTVVECYTGGTEQGKLSLIDPSIARSSLNIRALSSHLQLLTVKLISIQIVLTHSYQILSHLKFILIPYLVLRISCPR